MSNASELATLVCPPGTADAPISHGTIAYLPYRADQHDPQAPGLWMFRPISPLRCSESAVFARSNENDSLAPASALVEGWPHGAAAGWGGRYSARPIPLIFSLIVLSD